MKSREFPEQPAWMISLTALVLAATLSFGSSVRPTTPRTLSSAAPNGVSIPADYLGWDILSTSYRNDNLTLRVVLGNPIAAAAARAGDVDPWPDGAILAKLVWKQETADRWPTALVPGEFVHAEFMLKDRNKYSTTHGWGWARWLGTEQTPYGDDEHFVQECIACHLPARERDLVFTSPAELPRSNPE